MIACPSCGARNPVDATWCNLCALGLGVPSGAPPARAADTPDGEIGAEAAAAPQADRRGGAERPRRSESQWTCRVCDTATPITSDVCGGCGTSIFEAHGAGRDRAADRSRAAAWRFLPGVGHAALGDPAVAMVLVAVLGTALLFALLLASGGLVLGAVSCLLAAAFIWGAGSVDVAVRLEGRPPLLTGGRLLGAAALVVVIVFLTTRSGIPGG